MRKTTGLALLVALVSVVPLVANAQPASKAGGNARYAESKVFHIGGPGRWDYVTVDSTHHLLYITRTTHTMVLDAATGKTVADIPGQLRNHGVALVPEVGRGFITDGKDASVVVFDLKTYAVLGKIKAADDADGIIYDPGSRKVLVACGDANALLVISPTVDPKSGKIEASIPLGGKPEFLAADGKGKAYVNLANKALVAVVDIKAAKVIHKWPTAPVSGPVGLAMDPASNRLFIGCRKPARLLVMNAGNGKVLADLPIGAGNDAIRFDNGNIFASCGDGTLTIARETPSKKYKVVQTVKTRRGARTMGVDTVTHQVFLPTAEFGSRVNRRGWPLPKPDTFEILVVSPSPR